MRGRIPSIVIDPITELVRALESQGKPAFAWVVRWDSRGRDPVASAWARSCSATDMARLLELAHHPASASARKLLLAPILWVSTDHDRAHCEAIRRLVAVPPTLAELLAGLDSGMLAFATPHTRRDSLPAQDTRSHQG